MAALTRTDEVLRLLPGSIASSLKKNRLLLENLREIRLRAAKPVVVVTKNGSSFITNGGRQSYLLSDSLVCVCAGEISETVKRVCGYSVYSHEEDIKNGFVTVCGGHRVGLCGTAVTENGKTVSVRDINCVNIRIANEVRGCADGIVSDVFGERLKNIIIAGAPMSGKTTVLRDLARQLSDGALGRLYKCVIIDEREELAAVRDGLCENDVGINTDVLSGYPKREAIEKAVRTMSPDIVFCDETASEEEAREIIGGIMSGVHFIVSAHIGGKDDLYKRSVTKKLLSSGLFERAVILGSGERTGMIEEIVKTGDFYENRGSLPFSLDINDNGLCRRQANDSARGAC